MNAPTNRADTARRAIGLMDLTELGDGATVEDVRALCAKASSEFGTVAAVCVWPSYVAAAREALIGTPVRIATVTNFPSGEESPADVVAQTCAALADGADEIDVVMPYRAFAGGDTATARALLDAVRAAVPDDNSHLLKVILETGELQDPALIEAAARLAIGCGADMIKTSTGKTSNNASLQATEIMLSVIRELDIAVGLKPSGGIRTLDDAAAYLSQAERLMGPDWVSSRTFRFGASGLLTALIAEIDTSVNPGTTSSNATATDY